MKDEEPGGSGHWTNKVDRTLFDNKPQKPSTAGWGGPWSFVLCVHEELVMMRNRYRYGEPLKLRSILPSAISHWRWLKARAG